MWFLFGYILKFDLKKSFCSKMFIKLYMIIHYNETNRATVLFLYNKAFSYSKAMIGALRAPH